MPHGAQDYGYICFCVCGPQKQEDPKFWVHGWQQHYAGAVYKVWDPLVLVYLWSKIVTEKMQIHIAMKLSWLDIKTPGRSLQTRATKVWHLIPGWGGGE